MNEYIAIFFTHSGAIKFEKLLQSKDMEYKLMPVPRKLSSSCGICANFEFDGDLSELIDEEIEKIYVVKDNDYNLIYMNKN